MRIPVHFQPFAASAFIALATPALAGDGPVTVMLVGDSDLASYGSVLEDSFGPQLQAGLIAGGQEVEVIDTGFHMYAESGFSWLEHSKRGQQMLASPENAAVILELGKNDCEDMGLDKTRASLEQILTLLQEKHIEVLVVGTTAYDYCKVIVGPEYMDQYFQMFAELAEKYGDLYYPDLMAGVSGHPEWIADGDEHLNGQGNAYIVAQILPVVQELVTRAAQE